MIRFYSVIDDVTFGSLRGIGRFFRSIMTHIRAAVSVLVATIVRVVAYSLVILLPCFLVVKFVFPDEVADDWSEYVAIFVTIIHVLVALFRSIKARGSDPDMSEVISEIVDAAESLE